MKAINFEKPVPVGFVSITIFLNDFKTTNVPAMKTRDVEIFDCAKLSYYWKLNENHHAPFESYHSPLFFENCT